MSGLTGLTISHGGGTPLTLTKEFIEERLSAGIDQRLRNNFGGSNVTETFKIINAADSVKDGISTKLSKDIYHPPRDDVNADVIKTHMKNRLDYLIKTGEARRTMYHRVKGKSDYVSNISCTKALLDCGAHPDKILRKNPRIPLISTIGSFIDTGPGETTLNNTFPQNCDINQDIMSLLGYDDSRIKREGTTFVMKLAGFNYPTTPDITGINIKKELALGNVNKNALIKLSSTPIEKKKALVYYKSLGDKSLAFFYMLYWLYLQETGSRDILCLFTCDMFTSLYCLVFGVSFVFNTNELENGAKVTGVYHWTPEPINYKELIEKERDAIMKEYNEQIRLLNKMKDENEDIYFTGDLNVYSNRGVFIQLLIDKMLIFLDKVENFISSKEEGYNFEEDDHVSLKQYAPIILFNKNKNHQNMFITTKKRVCIADGGNIVSEYKNLREICMSLPSEPAGGGKATKHKKTYNRKNKTMLRPVLVGGTNNKINYDLDDAIKDLEERCNSIYSSIIAKLGVPDFFNNVIPEEEDEKYSYPYGCIYDEVTYYLYAKPDYSDANLFAVITNILESYVDDKVELYAAAAFVANERFLEASHYAEQYERTSNADSIKAKKSDDFLPESPYELPPHVPYSIHTLVVNAAAVDAAEFDESASKSMDVANAYYRTAEDNNNAKNQMIYIRDRIAASNAAVQVAASPVASPLAGNNRSEDDARDGVGDWGEVQGNLVNDNSQSQPQPMDIYATGNFVPGSQTPTPHGSPEEGQSQDSPDSLPPNRQSFGQKYNTRGVNSMEGISEMEGGAVRKNKTRMTNKKRKCTRHCRIRKGNKSKKARKNKNKKTRKLR